jgi:hypothetical protein
MLNKKQKTVLKKKVEKLKKDCKLPTSLETISVNLENINDPAAGEAIRKLFKSFQKKGFKIGYLK